jgi:hypothetical protein
MILIPLVSIPILLVIHKIFIDFIHLKNQNAKSKLMKSHVQKLIDSNFDIKKMMTLTEEEKLNFTLNLVFNINYFL